MVDDFISASLKQKMIASFSLKSLLLVVLRISRSNYSPIWPSFIKLSQTVTLLTELSLKHFISPSIMNSYGYGFTLPRQMQAETLTFQKLSFSSSTNRWRIALLGSSQSFDIPQQAILLTLLLLSHKHLVIDSIASNDYGRPINPNEFNAASRI